MYSDSLVTTASYGFNILYTFYYYLVLHLFLSRLYVSHGYFEYIFLITEILLQSEFSQTQCRLKAQQQLLKPTIYLVHKISARWWYIYQIDSIAIDVLQISCYNNGIIIICLFCVFANRFLFSVCLRFHRADVFY